MAFVPHTTPARRHPSWTPAPEPLGMLAKFFEGDDPIFAAVLAGPGRPLSPAERAAIDDLEHECDLIGTTPLPCERAWVLARVAKLEMA